MKKRLMALSLVSLVSCGLMAACSGSEVKWRDGVIIKIDGVDYTIDDAYRDYAGYDLDNNQSYTINADGAKAYYTVVNNVLIQLAVETTQAITNVVNARIDSDYYEKAKDNASANGTTKKEEQELILKSEGVKNVAELRAKFLLAEKTTRNEKTFYSDSNYTDLTPEYVEEKSPYHVRHILVKVDAASSDLAKAKISEDDAKSLSNVVKRLSGLESFGQVARTTSEDTGSAENFGDLGMMSTQTGFVSEFKYSLYSYDSYFNSSSDKALAKERLDIPTEADSVVGEKAFGIPLSAVLELEKYADTTTAENKHSVENASEENYPRNILFSNYFNNHGMSFIYLDKMVDEYKKEYNFDINSARYEQVTGVSDKLYKIAATSADNTSNSYTKIADSKSILCDEGGRPIIVTRAGTGSSSSDESSTGYQGIHFIVSQRSPFVDMSETVDGETIDKISKYYKIEIPSTTDSDTTAEDTYINFIKTDDRSVYEARANDIRNAVKGMDTNMAMRIYEANYDKASENSITINDKVKKIVDSYILTTRESTEYNEKLSYEKSWQSYLELLELQQSFVGRTLNQDVCIKQFMDGEIIKGGICDVAK